MLYERHVHVADVHWPRVEHLQALGDPAQQRGRHGGLHAFDVYPHAPGLLTAPVLPLCPRAWDGRLANLAGVGPKRLAGIIDSVAARLGRVRGRTHAVQAADEPPIGELLDVDREYRDKAAARALPTIAPRRFNPTGEAWLPVWHTQRGERHYTALFSNTPRAHQLGMTHDWVVLYYDGGRGEGQCTVITSQRGRLKGKRIVRGREAACVSYYQAQQVPFA
jgi:DNA polymerase (family X)